jgi:hypothetical protein
MASQRRQSRVADAIGDAQSQACTAHRLLWNAAP